MDKSKWEYKPFEDCIEKSKKTKQLMTSDYQPEGSYPIISQEASLISGYTDDADYVNHYDRPIIVFGDHTRVLKYVDFDFAVGADGVKILIPNATLNAKFLLNYLTWYKIPNLGYSRHYKLLKDISIPIPPISDQQRIVSELDCLNEMIALKQEQLKEFDKLAQSIFYDMFGDPITNEKGWKIKKLEHVCQKITDGTHNSPVNTEEGEYMYVTAKNIKKDGIILDDITYVSAEVHKVIYARCNPQYGDVLYIKDGVTTGIATINTIKEEFSLLSSVALLKPGNDIVNYYLKAVLNTPSLYVSIRKNMGGAAITRLTITKINSIDIPLPPLALQQQFAEKIKAIEVQKELVKKSIAETQSLLDYTMDKYFG